MSGDRKRVQGVIRKDFEPKDLQDVQRLEDKINELTVILEANHDIMQSLSGFYVNLMKNDDMDVNVKTQCADDVREFAAQIADMMYDVNMQIRRANLLVKITADRKALVCVILTPAIVLLTANIEIDPSASAEPSHRSNFGIDKTVVSRSNHHADHHYRNSHLLARYFCFGKAVSCLSWRPFR